jgi:hypothetical protein
MKAKKLCVESQFNSQQNLEDRPHSELIIQNVTLYLIIRLRIIKQTFQLLQ